MRSEVLRKMQLPPWSDNREIRAEAIRAMQANTTQLDPGLRKKLRRSCKEKYAQMNFDVTVSTWTLSNCLVEYDGQKRLSSKEGLKKEERLSSKPGLTKEERLSSKPGLKEGDCPSATKEQRLLIKVVLQELFPALEGARVVNWHKGVANNSVVGGNRRGESNVDQQGAAVAGDQQGAAVAGYQQRAAVAGDQQRAAPSVSGDRHPAQTMSQMQVLFDTVRHGRVVAVCAAMDDGDVLRLDCAESCILHLYSEASRPFSDGTIVLGGVCVSLVHQRTSCLACGKDDTGPCGKDDTGACGKDDTGPLSCGTGASTKENIRLLRCSRCWETLRAPVWYCSAACQRADYSLHKLECGKIG